jgi:hypothetical protein
VFFLERGESYGDLIVDNDGLMSLGVGTRLRPVGSGTILAVSADVLTASGAFVDADAGHLGHCVVVGDRIEAPFRIVDGTRDDLVVESPVDLREFAAVGDSYQGVICVRSLTVTGGAVLTTEGDPVLLTGGTLDVSDGGLLITPWLKKEAR